MAGREVTRWQKLLLSAGEWVVAKILGDKSASQSSMELYYPWNSGPHLRFPKIFGAISFCRGALYIYIIGIHTLTLQSLLFSISLLFLFSDFPCFLVRFSSLFPRILGVPRSEKPLLFWGKPLAFSKKSKDWKGQGIYIYIFISL